MCNLNQHLRGLETGSNKTDSQSGCMFVCVRDTEGEKLLYNISLWLLSTLTLLCRFLPSGELSKKGLQPITGLPWRVLGRSSVYCIRPTMTTWKWLFNVSLWTREEETSCHYILNTDQASSSSLTVFTFSVPATYRLCIVGGIFNARVGWGEMKRWGDLKSNIIQWPGQYQSWSLSLAVQAQNSH